MEKIIERIIKKRKEKGLSQLELSKILGKSKSTISDIETGNNKGSFELIKQLCEALEVSADYLIFGKEDVKEEELSEQGKQLLKEYKKYLKEHHPAEIRKIGNL